MHQYSKDKLHAFLAEYAPELLALFLGLALGLFLLSSGCAPMVINKHTSYKGKASATKPYVDMGKMHTDIFACDHAINKCLAIMYIKPHLHNPTSYYLEGQAVCKFSVAQGVSWERFTREKKSRLIKLGPRASKYASIRIAVKGSVPVEGGLRSFVSSSCWFRYRKTTFNVFTKPKEGQ